MDTADLEPKLLNLSSKNDMFLKTKVEVDHTDPHNEVKDEPEFVYINSELTIFEHELLHNKYIHEFVSKAADEDKLIEEKLKYDEGTFRDSEKECKMNSVKVTEIDLQTSNLDFCRELIIKTEQDEKEHHSFIGDFMLKTGVKVEPEVSYMDCELVSKTVMGIETQVSNEEQLTNELVLKDENFTVDRDEEILEYSRELLHYKRIGLEKYQCQYCGYKASQSSNLKAHINSRHTREKIFQCPHCNYSATQLVAVKNHINSIHTKANIYRCGYCAYNATQLGNLRRHVDTKHEIFKCRYCDHKSTELDLLKNHVNLKHKETVTSVECERRTDKKDPIDYEDARLKKFRCRYCEYKTTEAGNLRRHENTRHTKEKLVYCQYCDYKSTDLTTLKKHINSRHTKETTFPCQYCSYVATETTRLKKHVEARHTGEKKFECDECGYSATRRCNLQRHANIEHGKKLPSLDFRCRYCDYSTGQLNNLKSHINSKHTKEKFFQCQYCDYKVTISRNLKKHIEKKHYDKSI